MKIHNHLLAKVMLCSGLLLSLSSFNVVSAHHVHHHHYHYRRTRMIAHHHRRARHHRRHHKHWKWRSFYNAIYFDEGFSYFKAMRQDISSKRNSNKFLRMLPHLSYHQLNRLNYDGFHLDKYAEKKTEARYNYFRNKRYGAKLRRIKPKMTRPLKHSGNNNFARQEAQDEFNDVNNARVAKGLNKLLPNPYLQRVANLRAKQGYKAELDPNMTSYDLEQILNTDKNNDKDADNLVHGMDWHEDSDEDAVKLHLAHKIDRNANWHAGYSNIGENLAPSYVSNEVSNTLGDASGDPSHNELDNNPQNIAHNNVYDMLHYDLSSHNGHRQNIYNKEANNLATASYYLPHKNDDQIITVEEFY